MLNLPSAVSFGAKNSAEETTGSRNVKHARAEGARPHICMTIVSCCPMLRQFLPWMINNGDIVQLFAPSAKQQVSRHRKPIHRRNTAVDVPSGIPSGAKPATRGSTHLWAPGSTPQTPDLGVGA